MKNTFMFFFSFGNKRKIISSGVRDKVKNFMNKEHQIINSENILKIIERTTEAKKIRGGI